MTQYLLGKYVILRPLGEGGMACVFEAVHVGIRKVVALKVFKGPPDDDRLSLAKRFEAEARASAMVGSPHVVQIDDLGKLEDGTPYLVMERLQGETLTQRMGRGPLSLPLLLAITCQVLEALTSAHRAGLVHRDLKPSNIWLCDNDSEIPFVKILDFGVARFQAGEMVADLSIPDTSVALGTPLYMAPEQAFCDDLDRRADLYSLGAVLFRCLSGRHVYESKGVSAHLMRLASEDARPLRSVAPDVPSGLAAIVDRCLRRRPEERFDSAESVLAAVLALGDELGISWAPPQPPVMACSGSLPPDPVQKPFTSDLLLRADGEADPDDHYTLVREEELFTATAASGPRTAAGLGSPPPAARLVSVAPGDRGFQPAAGSAGFPALGVWREP